jgi:hypothetical protein
MKMLKAISSTSILRAGVLVVVFCFAAVLSAKATSESVTYTSPSAGACSSGGTGTLTIDASGDVSFQGVTTPGSGCSFSGSYYAPAVTTQAPAGSAANLAAFVSGTYYNNGDTVCSTACNTGQTVGIYISGSTIDLYDNNGGSCSTSDPFASSCSGGSLISGGSIIVLSLGSTSTPEPSSLMLLGSGLAVLMGAGLFRKQRFGDLI